MELVDLQFVSPAGRDRFGKNLARTGSPRLSRDGVSTLQINMGRLCNQSCNHCHVDAGPHRKEIMTRRVLERMVELAGAPALDTIDITGGAPEMNPHFRELIDDLVGRGKTIMVRCNLTILEEPGYEWLPEFYAGHGIHLVCSLPCYTREVVSRQRGRGVFDKSIAALRRLNRLGYGMADAENALRLDLVYNPAGASLPPAQDGLEADYRKNLSQDWGVRFDSLYTMANLPIGRFRNNLSRQGTLENYMALLDGAFNPGTVENLMCRTTLNVGWDGKIYDCDFNQMLNLEIDAGRCSIFDADFDLEGLLKIPVRTGDHCLACTAGAGSSCGGALAE